jgi:hypothetical protein
LWVTLAVLSVIGLGIWLWKRRKRLQLEMQQGAPLRPPEETIWDLINRLENSTLIAEGNTKEFYYQLSVGLRQYLENRFQFSALDRTTAELLGEFRRNNFSLDLTSLLRDFFDNSDLVKFAKFTPTENEVAQDLLRVKQVVTQTTPQISKEKETSEEKIPL